jgi:hypothetical protein
MRCIEVSNYDVHNPFHRPAAAEVGLTCQHNGVRSRMSVVWAYIGLQDDVDAAWQAAL